MTLQLFGHPFSSYTWKALIALYENATPFEFRMLSPEHPDNGAAFAAVSPVGKFPVLVDGETVVAETSIIIEYLQAFHPGAVRFIPSDPAVALRVRMLDRIFDNYVMTPVQAVVVDSMRAPGQHNPQGVADAKALLAQSYAWLDTQLTDGWAAGGFSLADCAAAPSLFYADWTHPIPDGLTRLRAYRARLLARPSVARAVDDARPYRHFFPLGAPDRD